MSKKTYKDYPKRIVELACLMYSGRCINDYNDYDEHTIRIDDEYFHADCLKERHLEMATFVFYTFFRPRMAAMNKELQVLRKYKAEHKNWVRLEIPMSNTKSFTLNSTSPSGNKDWLNQDLDFRRDVVCGIEVASVNSPAITKALHKAVGKEDNKTVLDKNSYPACGV